MTECY